MKMPNVSITELEESSGRSEEEFSEFIEKAIQQATLLLRLAMCREDFPDDDIAEELLREAIIEMALSLHQSNKYFEANSSPYSSETIGSYSYQKRAQQVQTGDSTGLTFFDLAVEKYSQCHLEDASQGVSSGGYVSSMPVDILGTGNYKSAVFPSDVRYPGVLGERF